MFKYKEFKTTVSDLADAPKKATMIAVMALLVAVTALLMSMGNHARYTWAEATK